MSRYEWLNDFIGIPYVAQGRDHSGVDCYGLVKLIYAEHFDKILPDWATDTIDLRNRDRIIASQVTSGTFYPVEIPNDGDFVVCYGKKMAHHIGLYFNNGVVHTSSQGKLGSVYEPIQRFRGNYSRIVFGKWKP